jgi:hypothetical protein
MELADAEAEAAFRAATFRSYIWLHLLVTVSIFAMDAYFFAFCPEDDTILSIVLSDASIVVLRCILHRLDDREAPQRFGGLVYLVWIILSVSMADMDPAHNGGVEPLADPLNVSISSMMATCAGVFHASHALSSRAKFGGGGVLIAVGFWKFGMTPVTYTLLLNFVLGVVGMHLIENVRREAWAAHRRSEALAADRVEQVRLAAHQQMVQTEREVERKAFRVVNHTSKRVMSNTAQACELILKQLQPHESRLEQACHLLHSTRAQAVNGFHMCRSMLLQAAVVRGDHQPGRDEFAIRALFEDLGLASHPRVESAGAALGVLVRTDKQLLTSIIYNAAQNALMHGATDGKVQLEALVTKDVLRITVRNEPGDNHSALVAALRAEPSGSGDLLRTERRGLEAMGFGDSSQSDFLGLSEMRTFANAFRPPADVHLWVKPESVSFELSVRVAVVAPPAAPVHDGSSAAGSGEAAHVLPPGLAFVCCDDDEMPRLFARVLLTAAAADEVESAILGESYQEVAGLVERVLDMGRRLGDAHVILVLDQNLDGYEEGRFLGTGLVGELRRRGFNGVLVIQSANDELEDEKAYVAAGADGSIGKAVKGGAQTMLSVIGRLWHARFA